MPFFQIEISGIAGMDIVGGGCDCINEGGKVRDKGNLVNLVAGRKGRFLLALKIWYITQKNRGNHANIVYCVGGFIALWYGKRCMLVSWCVSV